MWRIAVSKRRLGLMVIHKGGFKGASRRAAVMSLAELRSLALGSFIIVVECRAFGCLALTPRARLSTACDYLFVFCAIARPPGLLSADVAGEEEDNTVDKKTIGVLLSDAVWDLPAGMGPGYCVLANEQATFGAVVGEAAEGNGDGRESGGGNANNGHGTGSANDGNNSNSNRSDSSNSNSNSDARSASGSQSAKS